MGHHEALPDSDHEALPDTDPATLGDLCREAGLTVTVTGGVYVPDKDWRHVASTVTLLRADGHAVHTCRYRQGTGAAFGPGLNLRRATLAMVEDWERLRGWTEPSVADVVASLLLDGQPAFDHLSYAEWCDEMDQNSDSIKALEMFKVCCETGRKMLRGLSTALLTSLRTAAQEY